jgi:hypothetical protein
MLTKWHTIPAGGVPMKEARGWGLREEITASLDSRAGRNGPWVIGRSLLHYGADAESAI